MDGDGKQCNEMDGDGKQCYEVVRRPAASIRAGDVFRLGDAWMPVRSDAKVRVRVGPSPGYDYDFGPDEAVEFLVEAPAGDTTTTSTAAAESAWRRVAEVQERFADARRRLDEARGRAALARAGLPTGSEFEDAWARIDAAFKESDWLGVREAVSEYGDLAYWQGRGEAPPCAP